MIRQSLITKKEDFLGLEQEWKTLLPQTAADNIFLTWEWVSTWWKIFGAGKSLRVLTFRREAELVGIAPLCLNRIKYYGLLPLKALMFLGTGESVRSEYQDLIIKPGCEAEVTESVLAWLNSSRDWDIAILKDLSSESYLSRQLELPARRPGLPRLLRKSDNSYSVRLDGSYPEYLKSVSRQLRKNLTKETRILEARYSVRHRVIAPGDNLDEWMGILSDLHQDRMRQKHLSGKFSSRDYSRFHEKISRSFFARGWLFLTTLNLDNIPRAALYGFLYRNKVYGYQSGFDPEFARAAVMQVLLNKIIEYGFSAGFSEFDLLAGRYPHKIRLATRVRRLFSYTAFNRTLAGQAGWLANRAAALVRNVFERRNYLAILKSSIVSIKYFRCFTRDLDLKPRQSRPLPVLEVRKIDRGDQSAVTEICRLKKLRTNQGIVERFENNQICLAALASGQPIAFIWIDSRRYHIGEKTPAGELKPGEAFIYDYLVSDHWRGMNIFPFLLDQAADQIQTTGGRSMSLLLNTSDQPAIRAAGKTGFQAAEGGFKQTTILSVLKKTTPIARQSTNRIFRD